MTSHSPLQPDLTPASPSPDAAAIADHLRALYGAAGGDAPGVLSVFTLPARETVSFAGDALFGETPARIAALAQAQNVYHGVALLVREPATGRGTAGDTIAIPGTWLDLDIQGPNHKGAAYPASRDEALQFICDMGLEPSLVIDSGGGLQAWWLFRDLQAFASDRDRGIAQALSRAFQAEWIGAGAERGWRIDNTSDLARILRPAGTLNHKSTPARFVRTIYRSMHPGYTPKELASFCVRRVRAIA